MVISVSSNNGEAPASALATLPGANGNGSPHTAPIITVQSYDRVRAAMQAAGMGDLLPSDDWSCYRDRAAQQLMRDLGLTTAAVGTSIHGEWDIGSAVDFQDLGGFGAARHNWLKANGPAYGWYQPSWAQAGGSLPEPWHWEYDSRNDSHAGDGEAEDMTPAESNMLFHIGALLEETPRRTAETVHHWQISRFEGAPTSFLQDQTDGVTNTYTLVNSANATGLRRWSPVQVLIFLLALAVVLLVVLAPVILSNVDERTGAYLGTVGILAGAVATLVAVAGGRAAEPAHPRTPHVATAPPPEPPAPGPDA